MSRAKVGGVVGLIVVAGLAAAVAARASDIVTLGASHEVIEAITVSPSPVQSQSPLPSEPTLEPSATEPAPSETIPPSIISNNIDDAIRLWKGGIFSVHGGTLRLAHVDNASWVETTVGQTRTLIEPTCLACWSLPDETPIWLIVAYGQFQDSTRAIRPTPGLFTTAWAAVLEGGIGAKSGHNNQRYDLSSLGTVHELDPSVFNDPK